MQKKQKARRYNKGKLRYDLIPAKALEKVVEVYTKGAHKYTIYEDENGEQYSGKDVKLSSVTGMKIVDDGANNWRKGQEWTQSMASVKRHIAAWDKGEDIDEDLGTYHLANAVWGLLSLLEYYSIHPELDDRIIPEIPNIGLDIDGVLADFSVHYLNYLGLEEHDPLFWNDSRFRKKENWEKIVKNKEFFLTIPALVKAEDLEFEPCCYITARSIPKEWTEEWLEKHNFPLVELKVVDFDESKVEVAKSIKNLDIFIDDSYRNFVELNKNGILTYLMTRPHNEKYKVGHKRINNINEILKK